MKTHKTLILEKRDVKKLIDMHEAIETVEMAFKALNSRSPSVKRSDEIARGKYLFKNTMDEKWLFGIDVDKYWNHLK